MSRPREPLSQLGHQGITPLFIAAQHGCGEVVQQLIAAGPLGEDLKTSFPKVERGSHCQGVGTTEGAMWSLWVRFYGRFVGDSLLDALPLRHSPRHQHDSAKRCGPWPWGQVLIQPSRWTVRDSGLRRAQHVGDLLQTPSEGRVTGHRLGD